MYRLTDLNEKHKFKGYFPFAGGGKRRLNLLATGDVGGTLLLGLKLLGGDVIDSVGICDMNENAALRYEMEMNQIAYPTNSEPLPTVEVIGLDRLFDCDVLIFCASKAVPKVGEAVADMRMIQFAENRKIAAHYAKQAADSGFKGLFAVISDPVDPLCKVVYEAAGGKLSAEQIKGFGLGVMNGRAAYYAKRDDRFAKYLTEGRAFGPHGDGLVIADSLEDYNDALSLELTKLAVDANLRVRDTGFKPYLAPALSSGALSLLLLLRGKWHYSSVYIGSETEGAYMGSLNRMTDHGICLEEKEIPQKLFQRIKDSYDNLKKIV